VKSVPWVRYVIFGVLAAVTILAAGCGAHCADIAARRSAVVTRRDVATDPHLQIRIPLARANELLAGLVAAEPFSAELPTPKIGPFTLPIRALTAVTRSIELLPAPADRLRFEVRFGIEDSERTITTLAITAEIAPVIQRTDHGIELVVRVAAENLLGLTPVLDADAGHRMIEALTRWLPRMIRDHLPRESLDNAAQELREYLSNTAYRALEKHVLPRLGELTTLRLQLPLLPITTVKLAETTDAITLDLMTELPARHGLTAKPPASEDMMLRVSGSVATALANWGIERGHLPQHYTRDLTPKPEGEYWPWFEFVTQERRPVKIHIFQERNGCSYFQVGMTVKLEVAGEQLNVAMLDQLVEGVDAGSPLEAALWVKQLIQGSIDSTRKAATQTRFTFGERALVTRIIGATLADGEIDIALKLTAEATDPRPVVQRELPAPPRVGPPRRQVVRPRHRADSARYTACRPQVPTRYRASN
jgi:hypothetical protein